MSYPSLPFLCSRAQYPEIPVSGLPFPGAVIPLPDPAFPDPLLFYLLILIICLYLFLPLPFEVVDFSWGTSLADWESGFPSQPIRIGYVRLGGSLRVARTLYSSGPERPEYVGFPPVSLLDGTSGGSVPRSRWVHLRAARPLQKLGRREPRFPPEFPPILPAANPSRHYLAHPEPRGPAPTVLRRYPPVRILQCLWSFPSPPDGLV